ncbi:NACHT domain-containing protein [Stenomitos frigidus]|uniref:Histidine kinase n=1 Tax=Stenomitos frigidus ULC18 TaxID=2107698 RepID=A0A2T1E5R5_9CYAN|nr:NACHT domain-containing protein [Stenomitos frigidus]PSB28093.1 histidine kinase [Stenomitos frigidus ULC18]
MTGFEPLLLEAAKGLAGLVLKTAWEMGNKPIDEPIKQLIFNASHRYIENYEKRHGNLKIVCVRMDAPVRLDEVYTAVQLLERADVRYFESAETLQDLFRQSGRGFEFKNAVRQDGIAVANQHQYLMVLGGPGVGKSTFLRKVGLEALKRKNGAFQHDCVPVFLKLQDFKSKEIAIVDLIVKEFETCGFPEPKKFTDAALEKGKLLILLDGLDEVPTENLDHAIAEIGNLVDRYSKNRFIASCRIAAYKGGFQRFKDVAMAAFDDAQIEEFIRHWFRAEPEIATQCWDLLKQSEYAAAKELTQTPLLLTLLCVVYDESQDFPKNRAALHGEALDVLLKKWSAEKRLKRDPIYKELSPELEQLLLADLAHTTFLGDELFFSKTSAIFHIRAFLMDNLNAPKHLDGEAVLNAIEVQQGILVERARDIYSFSHLTLQEYLVAKYISEDYRRIEKLVTAHLTDERWREVFLLVAGLMGRADDLLEQMQTHAAILINTDNLTTLIAWADQATTDSESAFKPVVRRVAAIFLARSLFHFLACALAIAVSPTRSLAPSPSLALARSLAFSLDLAFSFKLDFDFALDLERLFDIDLALDRLFSVALSVITQWEHMGILKSANFSVLIASFRVSKAQISHNNQKPEADQEFARCVYQTGLEALHLQSEWIDLSEEEEKALENYLYANELMVRCKEAAVRVSRETWEAIEARMLTVQTSEVSKTSEV